MDEILRKAVDLWGEEFQRLMVIEECAELISALCKQFRGRVTDSSVLEEAVDVQLMIQQLKFMLDDHEAWNEQMRFKVSRLESRIRGEDQCL